MKDKQLLAGLSIGDGHIKKKGTAYSLCIKHCAKQLEYIKYKAHLLGEYLDREVNLYHYNRSGYEGYSLEVGTPHLKSLHEWLYIDRVKTLSLPLLRSLDDRSVALWYMDDGSLVGKKTKGKVQAYDLIISTCCTENQAVMCIDFFKERYNVGFTLKRNKGLFSIRCGTRMARVLLQYLQPHIIPSMSYKHF